MNPVPGALLTLDRVVAMILLEKLRLDIWGLCFWAHAMIGNEGSMTLT